MVTPPFGGPSWLGRTPLLSMVVIGLVARLLPAIPPSMALNDAVDYRKDRRKISECGELKCGGRPGRRLMAASSPRARACRASGRESSGLGLGGARLLGAWLLNPGLRAHLCSRCHCRDDFLRLMLRLSWTRALVSGAVEERGAGGHLRRFPSIARAFFIGFFPVFFFWKSGPKRSKRSGSDLEEDIRMGAETVPVRGLDPSVGPSFWVPGGLSVDEHDPFLADARAPGAPLFCGLGSGGRVSSPPARFGTHLAKTCHSGLLPV